MRESAKEKHMLYYYSDKTKKYYETIDEFKEAEAQFDKENALDQKEEFNKVMSLYDNISTVRAEATKQVLAAEKAYDEAKEKFIEKYDRDTFIKLFNEYCGFVEDEPKDKKENTTSVKEDDAKRGGLYIYGCRYPSSFMFDEIMRIFGIDTDGDK